MGMRLFHLERKKDISGVSGLGKVAEGVEFSDGMCALTWLSQFQCVNVYANIKTVENVHGHGGATVVVFHDVEEKEKE